MREWMMAGWMIVATALNVQAKPPVRATYREDLAPVLTREIDRRLEAWVAFYKELHRNPELSLHERESSKKIAQRLGAAGYDVTPNVGGFGVVGVLRNGAGPTVLIRGDMDALPVIEETGLPYRSQIEVVGAGGQSVGVMHACGHDIHQTCLVGTSQLLAHTRDHWRGTVVAIAQPAEEVGKGALMMIEDGLFDRFPRPDFCLALHVSSTQPAGEVGYVPGWCNANVDSVDVTIHGRGGHGSRPNDTIDPVVMAAHVIVALQTVVSRRVDPIEPAVITVGSVHGGFKHNIISNQAKLQITVRSYTQQTRRILLDGIRQVTIQTCRALGCRRDPDVVIREDEFTPAAYNDPDLSAAAATVLERALGADRVLLQKARMGGEDFGRFARHLGVPGFMFSLGSVTAARYDQSLRPDGKPLPSLHSSLYFPDPEPTIRTGVKGLASIALALLEPKE